MSIRADTEKGENAFRKGYFLGEEVDMRSQQKNAQKRNFAGLF